ncbi:acyltransferase [Rathayibacter sp. YIM 133350]|uniref:acyltransferase family protein n=1 Tax=Rathayibacter sp. YIM 133350 TaxID=3131992 RepID=UPI00307DC9C8
MAITPSPQGTAPTRLTSLDGLRGASAVVVVAYHALLVSPTAAAIVMGNLTPPKGTMWEALFTSPLRLFFSGNEAVFIFFVLSGFVLTKQVQRRPAFDWAAYYPSRLVRLYLPAAASVALALALELAFHRSRTGSPSIWVQFYTYPTFDWKMPIQAIDLFSGIPDFNSPLWSLRWEILFSLLLPVFVLIAHRSVRFAWITVAAMPVLVWLGLEYTVMPLVYLPAFAIGVALTVLLGDGSRSTPRRQGLVRNLAWLALTILSLAMLVAHWLTARALLGLPELQNVISSLVILGAAGVVAIAARWAPVIRLLSSAFPAWLGRISFSLYLIHVPVLIACANLLHVLPWYLVVLIAVTSSFALAVVFMRLVESPSHRLAKLIASRVGAQIDRPTPVRATSISSMTTPPNREDPAVSVHAVEGV